jgi:hypothetical protein
VVIKNLECWEPLDSLYPFEGSRLRAYEDLIRQLEYKPVPEDPVQAREELIALRAELQRILTSTPDIQF